MASPPRAWSPARDQIEYPHAVRRSPRKHRQCSTPLALSKRSPARASSCKAVDAPTPPIVSASCVLERASCAHLFLHRRLILCQRVPVGACRRDFLVGWLVLVPMLDGVPRLPGVGHLLLQALRDRAP